MPKDLRDRCQWSTGHQKLFGKTTSKPMKTFPVKRFAVYTGFLLVGNKHRTDTGGIRYGNFWRKGAKENLLTVSTGSEVQDIILDSVTGFPKKGNVDHVTGLFLEKPYFSFSPVDILKLHSNDVACP